VLRNFFGNHAIYALVISGASLIVAALCLFRVREAAHADATSPQMQVH
jgi:maltose/moltooligosaccharide transporter